jgi:septum formation protein
VPAAQEVARVSRCKALAVPRGDDAVVIAADTIVVCEGKVLGKPHSPEEAEQMLSLLSGRDHQVMTGVTVLRGAQERVFTEITDLHFRELTQKEIVRYVKSGEPMDKAGSYAIQGKSAIFIEKIHGDYNNVVGLPITRIYQKLKAVGIDIYLW